MDNEPIQQPVKELMETRLSLNEVLGSGWKFRSIFPDVKTALSDEGIDSLDAGVEVSPHDLQSDLGKFVTEANTIFNQNDSNFRARIVKDKEGNSKAFIVGKIGNDSFYQIAKYPRIYKLGGEKVIAWRPSKIGLVSPNGKVFSIDEALNTGKKSDKEDGMVFIEIAGRKLEANMATTFLSESGISYDTVTILPENIQQLGIYLHEVGHLLRRRTIDRDKKLIMATSVALDEFSKILATGEVFNPDAKLTNYQIRKINANAERGAWALGLSLIREAGRAIGLDCASPQAIKVMAEQAESALKTYDETPYTFLKHDDKEPMPAFSQKRRGEARKLHQLIKEMNISYSDLASFDNTTGESLANDPKKVLKQLPQEEFKN